jgi:hypothetical protein
VLELGEHLLDRVEVWTVRGQEQEPCAVTANGGADCMTFVAAEIVDDDDVAGLERGEEELLDIEMEAFAIDRPIKLEPGYRSLIPTKPPGVRVLLRVLASKLPEPQYNGQERAFMRASLTRRASFDGAALLSFLLETLAVGRNTARGKGVNRLVLTPGGPRLLPRREAFPLV